MRDQPETTEMHRIEPGLRAAAATDVGRHRRANEDSLLAKFPVFIVADGMGGHDAGDVASAAVVRAFSSLVGRDNVRPDEVSTATHRAHLTVTALSDRTRRGAGSTLTGVVQIQHDGHPYWLVVNVGDSRVYRLSGTRFERLTIDHSYVQEQLDAGLITPDEADTFEHKNVITRAVGAPDSPPDYWVHPVEPGERLLICSDGLHGEVPDEEIYEVLASYPEPASAVERLIDLALEHGGHDNVSAIVVDVDEAVAAEPDAPSAARLSEANGDPVPDEVVAPEQDAPSAGRLSEANGDPVPDGAPSAGRLSEANGDRGDHEDPASP